MAEVRISSTRGPEDVEMGGDVEEEATEVVETENVTGADEDPTEVQETAPSPQLSFIDYLKSPIIELLVGSGPDQTLLTAHQALLTRSPFFAEAIAQFSEAATTRRIELHQESLEAVGAFLQYLYTGEYFPRILGDSTSQTSTLEPDPLRSAPEPGALLLRHAKVYTLAGKLSLPELKELAHSKVHRVETTAAGELAYARYVYAHTPKTEVAIRKPIASFWGMRAYVLRHEAEDDFKSLCLEYPEFGFDVLSYVLDAREKRGTERGEREESGSKKKRARHG